MFFLNEFLNGLIGLSVDLKPSCWNRRLLVDSELLLHYSQSRCLGPRDEHGSTSWNIYMKLAGWCNEVSCVFPTTRLRKAPSFNVDASPPWRLLTFSAERISALCVGLPLCVFRELGWNVAALFKPSFLLDGMFYLPRHTMRWWSIPEMLHLLLRSFPELAGAESLISAPYLSLESVVFSHKGCLLSRGCFVNVSERFTNGHNSSRC